RIFPLQFISLYTPNIGIQFAKEDINPKIEYSSISYLLVIIRKILCNFLDIKYNKGYAPDNIIDILPTIINPSSNGIIPSTNLIPNENSKIPSSKPTIPTILTNLPRKPNSLTILSLALIRPITIGIITNITGIRLKNKSI